MSDFIRNQAGPCQVEKGVYLDVKTNEHGTIQVHPCTSSFCQSVFLFIPDDGWVYCVNQMMRDRLQKDVDKAISEKAPGFRPWHRVPLYNEAAEFIGWAARL